MDVVPVFSARFLTCLRSPQHRPRIHHPLFYFSMETMRKLFHILVSLQTLFSVLPFAIETLAEFFHLRAAAFP